MKKKDKKINEDKRRKWIAYERNKNGRIGREDQNERKEKEDTEMNER